MEIPFQIGEILDRLECFGFEAYIVGGCVRDYLMGCEPHDFDIATSALPDDTKRVFNECRIFDTGIKHGTVTLIYKGISVEITTFRTDGEYSDGRHPSYVTFTRNIDDDLARRDFTINGIAYSPRRGFIDSQGGKEDIKNGVIRCIGDADKRFSEDALRILRAMRFSAVLGFTVEEKTGSIMKKMYGTLRKISCERVFSELKRMLCGRNIKSVMLLFPEIFTLIIPPLNEQINYDQGSRFHDSNLYEHTARAVEAAPDNEIMRLAMLFHDTGKPYCRSIDSNGECHYYGHAGISAKIADEQLRALKCSNVQREQVCTIVKYHDVPVDLSKKYIRRAVAKYGFEMFCNIQYAHIADDSAKTEFCRERIPKALEAIDIAEKILSEKPALCVKDLAVSGNDLKSIVPPSPKMGEILNTLLKDVLDGTIPNEKRELLKRAEKLANS